MFGRTARRIRDLEADVEKLWNFLRTLNRSMDALEKRAFGRPQELDVSFDGPGGQHTGGNPPLMPRGTQGRPRPRDPR